MSPDQIREAIRRLYGDRKGGITRLAVDLDVGHRSAMAWLSGRRNVPGPAEVAISLLLELRPAAEPRMSAGELRKAMMVLFDDRLISQRQYRLAKAVRVSPPTVASWLSGRRSISGPAEVAVRLLLEKRALDTRGGS